MQSVCCSVAAGSKAASRRVEKQLHTKLNLIGICAVYVCVFVCVLTMYFLPLNQLVILISFAVVRHNVSTNRNSKEGQRRRNWIQ